MMSSDKVNNITWIIVIVTVLIFTVGALMPELNTSGDSLNNTGVPLGNIFASGGIIMLIIMAGFLFTIFYKIQEIKSFFGK